MMKSSIVVFLAILCYMVGIQMVSTRTIHDNHDEKHRHRRRSYYDYNGYYGRIDNDRQHEELLNEITRLLQELSQYVRHPPSPSPPAQIIYVPYPVSYPAYTKCLGNTTTIGSRLPVIEDINQIWTNKPDNNGLDMDDGKDGAKDITLDVVEPPEQVPQAPPVEHGSSQAGMTTTQAPPLRSRICQAAIVICCKDAEEDSRRKCFSNYRCFKTYSTGMACHKAIVKKALDEFTNEYGLQ